MCGRWIPSCSHRSSVLSSRRDVFFFLMIRRPPRSTLDRSSAASDVYKRQVQLRDGFTGRLRRDDIEASLPHRFANHIAHVLAAVSYTHLRAHETVLDLVCRLLLENKKHTRPPSFIKIQIYSTSVVSTNTSTNIQTE